MTEKLRTLSADIILDVATAIKSLKPENLDIEYFSGLRFSLKEGASIDPFTYDTVGTQFLWAKDVCLNNAIICEALESEAKRVLDAVETLAQLNKAVAKYGSAGKSGQVEITDGKAKAYVNIDPEVVQMRATHNSWHILTKFFMQLVDSFDKKHDWIKKLIDKEIKSKSMV